MSSSKIPLFDVDWTLLVGDNPVHLEAFDQALHLIYHLPNTSIKEMNHHGMIDNQILIQSAIDNGVSVEEANLKLSDAKSCMINYFMQHENEIYYKLMPGVIDLLQQLKNLQIPMGLLTGNIEEIGWEKLRRAGIADYFSFGAFGSMVFKRVDLIKIAREKASEVLGQNIHTSQFVIVGDTPLDIACARDGGIPVIAVGAGHFKTHELTHADLTLESLKEKDKILEFLRIIK